MTAGGVATFGTRRPGVAYEPRPAAYAVIRDGRGRFAAVRSGGGLFLPGGGIEGAESPRDAVEREVREECGRRITIRSAIGEAVEYFTASGRRHYELRAVFLKASFDGEAGGPGGDELVWLDASEAKRLLFHRSHAWAVEATAGL